MAPLSTISSLSPSLLERFDDQVHDNDDDDDDDDDDTTTTAMLNNNHHKHGITVRAICCNPSNDEGLPIAKPLFYDFPSFDMCGWEVCHTQGTIRPITYAPAARVDRPVGFPEIPIFNETVCESVQGLYEVANFFLAMNPTGKILSVYQSFIKSLKDDINKTGSMNPLERPCFCIQICEDLTYEIEALVGVMQVFSSSACLELLGTTRIGVYMTFASWSQHDNLNLNVIMISWLRNHWDFPFLNVQDTHSFTCKYGYPSIAIMKWLENARRMVWEPVLGMDVIDDTILNKSPLCKMATCWPCPEESLTPPNYYYPQLSWMGWL